MFQVDSGKELSAGEFKLVVDNIKAWPILISFTEVNTHALKFETEKLVYEVAFLGTFKEEDVTELKKCVWQGNESLKTISSMIPDDTLLRERQRDEIASQVEDFETFIGYIRKDGDWKAKQDLWIKNKEYRELTAKLHDFRAIVPALGVMIDADKLEFYLSFDGGHDIVQDRW
jgi:hypothetical protein